METNKYKKRKWEINGYHTNYKNGKFSKEEEEKIKKALCEYAFNNNLTTEELEKLITEKQTSKKNMDKNSRINS